ncbi:MAG TPA: GNAT family N-acyltransferase [Catenuloplanes sp.]|jgi:putative hemolysin
MTILAPVAPTGTDRYRLVVATDEGDVRAAQRLRHRVFAEELGAVLKTDLPGHDIDEFDAHCDHLIIQENSTGEVVGTYRMLPPGRVDRLYTDGEFNLAPLAALRDGLVETGRSCVHPEHRTGAVINLMWAGIVRYLHLRDQRWLIGCASVPLTQAAAVWHRFTARELAPAALRVRPHRPWPVEPAPAHPAKPPALLRGYLRLGAWICGPPAHDPDFQVADLPVLMSMDRMDARYLRHFLQR